MMTYKTLLGAVSALAIGTGVAMAQQSPSTTPTDPMTPPATQAQPSTATQPSGEPVLASELIGHDVVGTEGEEIGTVNDVVIDTGSGQIQQIVIKSGGVLGVGGKLVAVEFSEIQLQPNQGVQANLTVDQLKGMPDFDDETTVSLDEEPAVPATAAGPTGSPAMPPSTGTAPSTGTGTSQ